MAATVDAKADFKALTCASLKWEATGRPVPPPPISIKSARISLRFTNLGQDTWSVVADNRAAAPGSWASACPIGVTLPPDLTPWTQGFAVEAKNLYGMSVVAIGWQFVVASGSPRGSSDLSIGRLQVKPLEVTLAWGWKASLDVVVEAPLEYEEQRSVIALLPVRLKLTLETKVKRQEESQFHLVSPSGVFPA